MIRSSASDWNKNVETIMQWSPFSSELDLLRQVSLHSSYVETDISYDIHFSSIFLFCIMHITSFASYVK